MSVTSSKSTITLRQPLGIILLAVYFLIMQTVSASPKNPPLSLVAPGIYIGNDVCPYDETTYTENNIHAVLSLVPTSYNLWNRAKFKKHISPDQHMYIKCLDTSSQNLFRYFPQIVTFIETHLDAHILATQSTDKNLEKPSAILVHCEKGVSRSATAVIAYLMKLWKIKDPERVLEHIQKSRAVKPNRGFMAQLRAWGEVDFEPWEDEEHTKPKKEAVQWLN